MNATGPISCTVCGVGAKVDAEKTGYCEACEETIAEKIDAAYEALYPIVFSPEQPSEIARRLWLTGYRVIDRDAPNAPRCRGCGGWSNTHGAALHLSHAINEVTTARDKDADMIRRHMRRAPAAELNHWVQLCARVFRHLFTASLLLQHCDPCVKKMQDNAPKILRPVV